MLLRTQITFHFIRKHGVNSAGEAVTRQKYPCEECGKLLTTRTKLAQHVKTIHRGEKGHECSFCGKKFTSK